MITYSKLAEGIPASPIRAMMVKAAAMDDCISFAVGDPDFSAPDCAIEALKAAGDAKKTHYAPGAGINELRQTYAEYVSKMTGNEYTMDNVAVTVGGMSSLYLCLLSALNPGDEVLIAAPYFTNYSQMVRMVNAVPVSVDEKVLAHS